MNLFFMLWKMPLPWRLTVYTTRDMHEHAGQVSKCCLSQKRSPTLKFYVVEDINIGMSTLCKLRSSFIACIGWRLYVHVLMYIFNIFPSYLKSCVDS